MTGHSQLASLIDPSRLERNKPLAPYTTFQIGGTADLFYTATSAEDLANAVLAARKTQTPYFILGLGANILIGDKGFRGLVIHNKATHTRFFDEVYVEAESGTTIADLIPQAIAHNLSGLEHYVGIPSTVGGAVWQNLHFLSPAPERERTMFIAEVVHACDLLMEDGTRKTVPPRYMEFGYDTSILHRGKDVALSVTFKLQKGSQDEMHRILQENLSWRGSRHPWLQYHPSAGSIFKKIEGIGAGRLIDQCGLKGFRLGNAQVSHIHANIMVNLGGATAKDVRNLIVHVQQTVERECHQHLEPEIGFIGEF